MKIVKETKIQKVSGSYLTTIPNLMSQINDVEKGDYLEWSQDLDNPEYMIVRVIKKPP